MDLVTGRTQTVEMPTLDQMTHLILRNEIGIPSRQFAPV